MQAVDAGALQVIRASDAEVEEHNKLLDILDKKSEGAIWRRQS